MKLLVFSLLTVATSCALLAAPMPEDGAGMECSANHGWFNHSATFAQSRQERIASASVNSVDPGQNGSVRVHGWDNSDVLVKACVQTAAATDSEARDLASQIRITKGPGHIEASGPATQGERNWSVSYEIWMPSGSSAKLETSNGSIGVEGVRGSIRFHSLNGSIRLSGVTGEVEGSTTNGSVHVTVADAQSSGGGLRLETTNGSVRLELPQNYSARVEASTTNGSIRTDFPITVSGDIGKHLSFTLGNGGGEIEARTTNGSIHITRRA